MNKLRTGEIKQQDDGGKGVCKARGPHYAVLQKSLPSTHTSVLYHVQYTPAKAELTHEIWFLVFMEMREKG